MPRQIVSGNESDEAWDWWLVHMILEMLPPHTLPSCITANILTMAELLNPDYDMVEELPSVPFIRPCRSVNLHLIKR